MLAYYVEWHLRRKLVPLLSEDEQREEEAARRDSPVAPAEARGSASSPSCTLGAPRGSSIPTCTAWRPAAASRDRATP